ncbi:hypothetical protein [Kitasatospora cheerisanensis]|uniref:Uncharacterized protein n=1 Tax=Kitasatospora cheerisanensis KCTC 2395 TaxID=1348663 RepID=A0A066Z6E2_9ACTN|nr:hypothetical protein [Kitasatospora cheerisanensis]KDN85705.1 hypothetical protein KCH_25330 [Kitasatospora cheerisanensis KCTC 2395]
MMMSRTRENVTWQSKDGSWNIGFYAFTGHWEYGDGNHDEFDPEWDVDYHKDEFWFLSTGHPNPEAAYEAYCAEEPNPGYTMILAWTAENASRIEELEAIAAAFAAPGAGRGVCLL